MGAGYGFMDPHCLLKESGVNAKANGRGGSEKTDGGATLFSGSMFFGPDTPFLFCPRRESSPDGLGSTGLGRPGKSGVAVFQNGHRHWCRTRVALVAPESGWSETSRSW